MSNNNEYGFTNWDSLPKKKGKDDFLTLKNGSNKMRLVTKPALYWVHKYKPTDDDPGYGEKVYCSYREGDSTCPLCDEGYKRYLRCYIGVIDRSSDSYKLVDLTENVMTDIKTLANDDEWGDPSRYDIDIVVNKAAQGQGYYTVIPKPHKALTDNDKRIIAECVDLDAIKARVEASTHEKVLKRIEFIKKKISQIKDKANTTSNSSHKAENKKDVYDFSQE